MECFLESYEEDPVLSVTLKGLIFEQSQLIMGYVGYIVAHGNGALVNSDKVPLQKAHVERAIELAELLLLAWELQCEAFREKTNVDNLVLLIGSKDMILKLNQTIKDLNDILARL